MTDNSLTGDTTGTQYSGSFTNWWNEKKNDPVIAGITFATVTRLNRYQSYRRDTNIRTLRLFGGTSFINFSPYSYTRGTVQLLQDDRPRYNVIASCIDTVYSKIAKNKPRPTPLTDGGDYSLQRKAQDLGKFILGVFEHVKMYDHGQTCFRDGCIFDVGALKLYREGSQIKVDRIFPNELYVDDADAFYGYPSHIYQVKYVLKSVLAVLFPKYQSEINGAQNVLEGEGQFASNTDTRYAVVIEGWHLRSGPEEKDGRHCITINGAGGGLVLVDEPYEKDYLPFVFFRWSKPTVGFWGYSLAQRLMGKQIEINRMLQIIQQSFKLGAAFKVFLEHGSRVAAEHLTNDIGSITYYTGTPPSFTVPQTVHPEFFNHLNWLIKSSFEESGISQLSAGGKKPAGLDAAVALREYQDIESERFAVVQQHYEQIYLDAVPQIIDLVKEIDAEEEGGYSVKAESKKFLETIKWKDVEVDGNEMMLKVWPTSMLPRQPEGRLAMVTDLMNGGFIDRETGLALLNFPDTETAMELRLAPIHDLENTIAEIIEKGEYNPPEPFQNLQLGLQMFTSAYLKARTAKVPEEKLDLLRQWMSSAQAMIQAAQQAQQPAAPQAMPVVPGQVSVGNPKQAPGLVSGEVRNIQSSPMPGGTPQA